MEGKLSPHVSFIPNLAYAALQARCALHQISWLHGYAKCSVKFTASCPILLRYGLRAYCSKSYQRRLQTCGHIDHRAGEDGYQGLWLLEKQRTDSPVISDRNLRMIQVRSWLFDSLGMLRWVGDSAPAKRSVLVSYVILNLPRRHRSQEYKGPHSIP